MLAAARSESAHLHLPHADRVVLAYQNPLVSSPTPCTTHTFDKAVVSFVLHVPHSAHLRLPVPPWHTHPDTPLIPCGALQTVKWPTYYYYP